MGWQSEEETVMAVNGKRKGSAFERELCKKLESIFGGTFTRTPHSGAFGTINHSVLNEAMKQTLTGDIITPKNFKFSIEAKSYKAINWHQIAMGKCPVLDGWIAQSERDAITAGKDALLIFKISRQGIFMVFDADSLDGIIKELPQAFIKYKDKIIISMDEFKRIVKHED